MEVDSTAEPTEEDEGLEQRGRPRRRRAGQVGVARALGATLRAAGADPVTVEARFEFAGEDGPKKCEVSISGLPDAVIRESRGRLLAALEAHGLGLPPGRLLLHLQPAGLKKSGELLDLPLAMAAAAAGGAIPARALQGLLLLGEVALDGELRAVPGGLAAADAARSLGLATLVAPLATAREAAALPGLRAFGCGSLGEVVGLLSGAPATPMRPEGLQPPDDPLGHDGVMAIDQIRGQLTGKRALEVAAAGGHALLFHGPPGAGKSMLARALVELLPPLDLEERVAVTRVLSAAGRWPGGLARRRSFRAPHHTTSHAGLVGGGSPPVAGEITLAHRGVLFLDELPEFRREALEALRQPLEEGQVLISRVGQRALLPADFQLVCAMNPCPCGYRGHPRKNCRCAPASVARYRQRISGPLLDRVDLRVELGPPSMAELLAEPGAGARPPTDPTAEPSSPAPTGRPAPGPKGPPAAPHNGDPAGTGTSAPGVDGRTRARRARQARATALERQNCVNARLDTTELDEHAPLDRELRRLVGRAAELRAFSARAVQSLRRVALTLADLEGAERPARRHLLEALSLRAE